MILVFHLRTFFRSCVPPPGEVKRDANYNIEIWGSGGLKKWNWCTLNFTCELFSYTSRRREPLERKNERARYLKNTRDDGGGRKTDDHDDRRQRRGRRTPTTTPTTATTTTDDGRTTRRRTDDTTTTTDRGDDDDGRRRRRTTTTDGRRSKRRTDDDGRRQTDQKRPCLDEHRPATYRRDTDV